MPCYVLANQVYYTARYRIGTVPYLFFVILGVHVTQFFVLVVFNIYF